MYVVAAGSEPGASLWKHFNKVRVVIPKDRFVVHGDLPKKSPGIMTGGLSGGEHRF